MKKIIATTVLVVSTFISSAVFAQSDTTTVQTQTQRGDAFFDMKRPHFGVSLGVSEPEGSYDGSGEVGVNFGYQPFVPWGFGASLNSVRNLPQDDDAPDIERTTLLARGSFHFAGDVPVIRHSWMGVGMGPVFSDDGTDFAVAPIVGFDIPIGGYATANYVSLGADAQYLIVNNDQPDAVTVSGVMKFWF